MGYREYFAKIKKGFVQECQNAKNVNDFIEITKKYYPEVLKDKTHDLSYNKDKSIKYIPFYAFKNIIFEFGKYYENSNELIKLGKPLFPQYKEMQKEFNTMILDENGFLSAIKWQENYLVGYYKKILDLIENENIPSDKKIRTLYSHVLGNAHNIYSDYLDVGFVNLDKDNPYLTNSWCYEHNIFNLIYLYKTFDWENYDLIFYGW